MINLAHGFTDRGYPVDLLAGVAEGRYREILRPDVRLINFGQRRLVRAVPAFLRYLRDVTPSVVISAIGHTNVAAIWGARRAGKTTRTVATVHSTISAVVRHEPTWKVRATAWAEVRALRQADATVAVSEGVAADLHALAVPRVQVIPNPIVTPELLESSRTRPDHPWLQPGAPPLVVAVGRLNHAKDFGTLLRAFALVRAERAARLLILGEGEERPALESLVRELGIGGDVQLAGFVPDPIAYVRHAQLFVLSSIFEGLPSALIEAVAVGANIVATDCESGPREILEQGKSGRLVPPRDFAALGAAMLIALTAPHQPGDATAAKRYSSEAVVDAYLSLIQPMISRSSALAVGAPLQQAI